MKRILLFLLFFTSWIVVFSTPDFQPHKRVILLGCNSNSMFYLQYSTNMSSTYSASDEIHIIQQSLIDGQILEAILIRQINYNADSETQQLSWTSNEKVNTMFDLNRYLIKNNINLIFADNLIFTHSIEINENGISITGKGNEFPLFLSLSHVELYVPYIKKALDWKTKYHNKYEWNWGEIRVIESYSTGNYIILKVEVGKNHPESLFQQSLVVIKKK